MSEQTDGEPHTHHDGTTHDDAHVGHEHEQHDNVDAGNEHVHEDGTTHSHDEGAESKRPGLLARLFGAR